MSIFLVKDLAYETGYSVETIKYYLRIGLIKETGKTKRTNFRYFDEKVVNLLQRIRALRTKGISISRIRMQLKQKDLNQ